MAKITHNKLVRDRVIEKIKTNGEACEFEVLHDDGAYERALKAKVSEEAAEISKTTNTQAFLSEYADLMVVLDALTWLYGISPAEIELALKENIQKKGYFKKRHFLKSADAPK